MTTNDHAASGSRAAPGGVEIRPVTIDDLETLIDIYLDTARHHAAIEAEVWHVPAREDIAARLRPRIEGRGPTSEYVVAIVDGEAAGSASVHLDDPPTPGNMLRAVPSAEFGVSVVEGFRGRGIGRALIAHLEQWAAERGAKRMVLNVSSANEGAIRLYEDLGYREYDRAMLKPLVPR
ncbi:MAG TPA: GNAT family N-acetyltransferase [Candidatus Limnocylindrales bacterium]|nr:GNAT family N-acetyltransferase [Candidatus Limnocylindrales bacterium]